MKELRWKCDNIQLLKDPNRILFTRGNESITVYLASKGRLIYPAIVDTPWGRKRAELIRHKFITSSLISISSTSSNWRKLSTPKIALYIKFLDRKREG